MGLIAANIDREFGISVIFLLIVGVWILSQGIKKYRKNRYDKILEHGVESEATVLSVGHTGLFINNSPQLKVQMQVRPGKGRNFVTEVKQVIPQIELDLLKEGCKVIVKYDPAYPKKALLLKVICT